MVNLFLAERRYFERYLSSGVYHAAGELVSPKSDLGYEQVHGSINAAGELVSPKSDLGYEQMAVSMESSLS